MMLVVVAAFMAAMVVASAVPAFAGGTCNAANDARLQCEGDGSFISDTGSGGIGSRFVLFPAFEF